VKELEADFRRGWPRPLFPAKRRDPFLAKKIKVIQIKDTTSKQHKK